MVLLPFGFASMSFTSGVVGLASVVHTRVFGSGAGVALRSAATVSVSLPVGVNFSNTRLVPPRRFKGSGMRMRCENIRQHVRFFS